METWNYQLKSSQCSPPRSDMITYVIWAVTSNAGLNLKDLWGELHVSSWISETALVEKCNDTSRCKHNPPREE